VSRFFANAYCLLIEFKVALRLMNYSVSHSCDFNVILIVLEGSPEGDAVNFYKEHILSRDALFSEIVFYRRLSFVRILRNFFLATNKPIQSHKFSAAVFGSNKGTVSRKVKKWLQFDDLIEVQHGALDSSYFPIQSDIFVCRSSEALNIIKDSEFQGILLTDFFDLDAKYEISHRMLDSYDQFILFSKNPGGGVSWSDLANAEATIFRSLASHKLHIIRHPRDSILKFWYRHMIYMGHFKYPRCKISKGKKLWWEKDSDNRLHIGLDTTAIVDRCVHGDHVLDVRPEEGNQIKVSRINKHLNSYGLDIFDMPNTSLIDVGVVKVWR
jgi:hypothetical protein